MGVKWFFVFFGLINISLAQLAHHYPIAHQHQHAVHNHPVHPGHYPYSQGIYGPNYKAPAYHLGHLHYGNVKSPILGTHKKFVDVEPHYHGLYADTKLNPVTHFAPAPPAYIHPKLRSIPILGLSKFGIGPQYSSFAYNDASHYHHHSQAGY